MVKVIQMNDKKELVARMKRELEVWKTFENEQFIRGVGSMIKVVEHDTWSPEGN